MTLFIQDPDSFDSLDDENWDDPEHEYDPKSLPSKQFYKDMTAFGGKTDGKAYDQGERTGQNEGDACFYFEFSGISKDDIFKLMKTDCEGESIDYLFLLAQDELTQEELDAAEKSPDTMIEMLKKAADNDSWGIVSISEV